VSEKRDAAAFERTAELKIGEESIDTEQDHRPVIRAGAR